MQARIPSLLFRFLFIAAAAAPSVAAQVPSGGSTTASDSIYAHARALVLAGNGAAGRVIVDSMVAASTPDTPEYGEALYWRAALAASAEDAERDYRRVVVEYPLSRRAGDALLQLAQLELAHGDRKTALTHLQRFVLENPRNTEHDRASLLLVKTAFDQNDQQMGCLFLGRSLTEVPDSEVELRNQFGYYTSRCAGVDTTRAAAPASNAKAATPEKPAEKPAAKPTAKSETPRRDTTRATPAKAKFTLQIAAYAARADADRLAKRLDDRGLDARVVGKTKPFRVRVGHYATRAEALAAAKNLKAKKIDAYVTDIGADDK